MKGEVTSSVDGYGLIASVYDSYLFDFSYTKYAGYIKKKIKENKIKGAILDAGCGTGTLLSLLSSSLDNELIGIDNCEEMLSIAEKKNTRAILLAQDITGYKLSSTVGCVVSTLDVINHLKSLSLVLKFFTCTANHLEENGIFIFDMNLPYKHEKILSDDSYIYEVDGSVLLWRNKPYKKKVLIGLDVFLRSDGGMYKRYRTEFYEYTYALDEIEKLLNKYFLVLEISDGETFSKLTENSQRALIYTKRK